MHRHISLSPNIPYATIEWFLVFLKRYIPYPSFAEEWDNRIPPSFPYSPAVIIIIGVLGSPRVSL